MPAHGVKMIVILNRKALVPPLIDVAITVGFVVRVISLGMRHRYPTRESRHRLVTTWRQHHVPVVFHPLVANQINGVFFQPFANHPLQCLEISRFEEDVIASIATVQSVVNIACKI